MLPYYLSIVVVTLLSVQKEKKLCLKFARKKVHVSISFVVVFLMLLLVMGLRFEVGADYQSYAWIFEHVNTYGIDSLGYIEWGFRLFSYIIGHIVNNVYFYFFVNAVIILGFYLKGIYEQSSNYFLSFAVFIGLGYFFFAMNLVRQFVAIAILFFANKYIITNWKKYLLLAILASLFHSSALMLIPASLIVKHCKGSVFYFFSTVVSFFVCIFCSKLLDFASQFSGLANKVNTHTVTVGRLSLPNIFLGSIVFVLGYYLCRRENGFWWKLRFNWIALMLFIGLAPLGDVATRTAFYFTSIYLVMIPEIINKFCGCASKRFAIMLVAVVCFAYMHYVIANSLYTGNNFYPYRSIISAPDANEYHPGH